MQIKTKLKILSWIAAIMAILVMIILAWTSEQLKQSAAQHDFAEEMFAIYNNRVALRDEYILNHNERPKEQWLQQTENLKKLVERAQADVVLHEQKLIFQQTPLYLDKTKKLFTRLVVNQDEMVAGRISIAQSQEMERLIYSQLIIDSHSLLTRFLKLQRISDREYKARQSRSNVLVLVCVLLLACFTIFSSMMVVRSIATPLIRLRDGLKVIGDGNLDYQIVVKGDDELSNLAYVSNEMAAKLKKSYTSLENLQQEITERKQAEEALRDAELKFRTIFDKTSDGILLAENGSRTFYMANNEICEMLGYTQNEIIKIGLSEIHLEKDLPYVIEQFERMAKNEISIASDIPVLRKDGSIFYADINSSSVTLGGKDYIIGVFRNITERKQAEDKIRHQSRLLAAINRIFYETLTADSEEAVAKACLGVVQEITDSKFGFIGEITPEGLFTTTALSDPGWETCRIPETQATVLIKDMVIRGIWGQVLLKEQSLIVNDPLSYPGRVGIPEGHPPLTSFLGVPLKERGKVVGMIAMGNRGTGYTADNQQDMEALSIAFVEAIRRKQAEEKIKQLNNELEQRVLDRTFQLEASNKELASFAYSVSHDLRAPLRGIDGWSLALLEDYGEKLDDQARKYLHRVRTETQLMGRLIDDMLKLSRVTRAELKLMPIDLTAMAHSIADRLQEEMPQRRIEFIIQPALRADGDSQMIDIALSNLFDNAVKFTGTRSPARIEFGEAEVDGGKVFFVQDDGVGFDMTHAPKLFGAFQRLHKSSEFPGTGVGLATVQRIIHRHGGRIWANAQVDQGATFYFTLKETI
jgi:PAS domain S-box-containing protein